MRRFVLPLAIASVLAAPLALAQPAGGGVPAVAAAAGVGNVRASADDGVRTGASDVDRHPRSRPPKTPEQVMAGLSTAERAQKLREADLNTRKEFGVYQSVVADARRDGDPTDAAVTAVLGIQAQSATRAQIARFGEDTDERARELRGVGRATRRAFDKFQAALWREQDLAEAAGPEARVAAYGADTAPAAQGNGAADPSAPANTMAQEPQESGDQNH
jgi:hypothetical protein